MSFKFSWLCELLSELESQKNSDLSFLNKGCGLAEKTTNQWFARHQHAIPANGPAAIAFLSALLPERRPDRTYNLQDQRLTRIFARALCLGRVRLRSLSAWQNDGPDLALCLENVIREAEHPIPENQVTLEELDEALDLIAGHATSSAPEIRERATSENAANLLPGIIRRLQSHEAKWLVRMVRKDYSPVEIPEHVVLINFHFLMPHLLRVQNSFQAALNTLACPDLRSLSRRPGKDCQTALLPICVKAIRPELNIMIQRQPFHKARSIKHCVSLAAGRNMSLERKYDGEYCQIHIDMSRDLQHFIKIFSKAGRDSTEDRLALQNAIQQGLGINTPSCKIRQRAILEGELIAYSQTLRSVLPFYHVRKHVLHGGRRIGCDKDSPKKFGEQLMIVFFDVLLLDDRIMINEPYTTRRVLLKALVKQVDGISQVVERQQVDFSKSRASFQLRTAFSQAIRDRWEGLVLKGCQDPYVSWIQAGTTVKLKKDYIGSLGDTIDLCIVGARRDARTACSNANLTWTHFFVACILNKQELVRFRRKPLLRIVDCISQGSLARVDLERLNTEGKFLATEFQLVTEYMSLQHPRRDIGEPSVLFTQPLIIELMGAGFERPQTVNFYILRFPRKVGAKLKIHQDRDLSHVMSFNELQDAAQATFLTSNHSQEDIEWIEKLKGADPQGILIQTTPRTDGSVAPLHSLSTCELTAFTPRILPPVPAFQIRPDDKDTPVPRRVYAESMPDTPIRSSETTPNFSTANQGAKRKWIIENEMTSPKRTFSIYRMKYRIPNKALTEITNDQAVISRHMLISTCNEQAILGLENVVSSPLKLTTAPARLQTPDCGQAARSFLNGDLQRVPGGFFDFITSMKEDCTPQWRVQRISYLSTYLSQTKYIARRFRELDISYTTSIIEFIGQASINPEQHIRTVGLAFIDPRSGKTAFDDLVTLFGTMSQAYRSKVGSEYQHMGVIGT